MSGNDRSRGHLRAVDGRALAPRRVDPPPVAGRPPPHNLDAEAAVLSAAMLDRMALDRVLEILKPEHFYSEANARIFQAAQQLALAMTPVDNVSVASWLRDREWLQKIGGTAYLAQLADATPAIGHVVAHANVVHEKWRLRQLIATCQRVAAEGYGDVGEVQHFINGARTSLDDVAAGPDEELDQFHIGAGAAQESAAACVAAQRASIEGPFVDTGVREIDAVTNIGPSEVLIIGATKGLGKTTLVRSIAHRIAKTPQKLPDGRADCDKCSSEAPCCEAHAEQKRGVLVLALEGKRQDWADAITAKACGLNIFDRAKAKWSNDDHAAFLKALEELKRLPIVVDDRKNLCKRNLGPRVRAWREWFARKGARLDMIALDYFQIAAWERTGGTREEDLSDAGRHIITLATDPESELLGIAWVVIVALNKEGGARESGAIEYHADAFWRLTKSKGSTDEARALRLWVEKQRRGPSGVGASFWFDPAAGHFWS